MEMLADKLVQHVNKLHSDIYVIYCVPVWFKIFEKYRECIKIYENFNKDKTDRYIVVFRISAGKN
jgi:hypothetical protein